MWPKRDYEKKELFERIMMTASVIIEKNPMAIEEFKRMLLRCIQSYYLTLFLRSREKEELLDSNRMLKMLWFDPDSTLTKDGKTLNGLKKRLDSTKRISMRKDPVLAMPWKSTIKALDMASGIKRGEEKWSQNSNHIAQLWLPVNVAFVKQGHHSVTAGILAGEGELIVSEVYDMKEIYEYVSTDGVNYIRTTDNKVVAPVNVVEFAAVFEIGRLQMEKDIQP